MYQTLAPLLEDEVKLGRVPVEGFPLEPAPTGLIALYFIGPDNAVLSEPARVRFPNDTGLSAGAEVELVGLGNIGTAGVLPPGSYGAIGDGIVTDDGLFVASDPSTSSGLITFGWVGYRGATAQP